MAKIQIPQVLKPEPKPELKPKIPCPDPMFDYPQAPYLYDSTDFSSVQLNNPNPNPPRINSYYLFTAKWKPKRRCCQVIKAEVTMKLKALSGGANPNNGSDAGNDSLIFVKNGGQVIKGLYIYPAGTPFSAGYTVNRTFVLSTPAELSWLNSTHKLSFLVQDDTEVCSVRVRLTVCCLNESEK